MSSWFTWGVSSSNSGPQEFPALFPLSVKEADFIKTDVVNIFSKILTDVLERTQGIPKEYQSMFWDNCLQSESDKGVISLLAEAMAEKQDLILVIDKALKVVRKASTQEASIIKADYSREAKSKTGVFISFKHYDRATMVKLYSMLEYLVIVSLNKSMNMAKAIQIKIANLRGSVALTDRADAEAQVAAMVSALSNGRDTYMDKDDDIVTAKIDIDPTQKAMDFIESKRAFYLGLPKSYITGEQTAGIGSTGEADMRAVERGLKSYYFSIIKPTADALFGVETSFKSQDFRLLSSGLEALKTFALVDDALIPLDRKKTIIESLFGFETEKK